MGEPLHIGLAGCGWISRQVHIPLLQRHRDVRIVAIADIDEHTLNEAAPLVSGARRFRHLDDMLSKERLDAVVVALPPSLHAVAACAVFDAGLHLYLEKPLATTLDEGAAIIRAWRRSGRVGVMGFNCRANPLLVRLRELIHAGRAGRIKYIRTFFSIAARTLPSWKQRRASGGGALLDLGVHHIDLVRFLTGREITGVRASVSSQISEQDTALVELQLEGGVGAHIFSSLASAEGDHVEVHGDLARLSVARYESLDVHVIDNPGRGMGVAGRALRRLAAVQHLPRAVAVRRSPLREPGYAVLLERFIRACQSPSMALNTPGMEDGFAAAAAVAAAELSVTTGQMERPAGIAEATEPMRAASR